MINAHHGVAMAGQMFSEIEHLGSIASEPVGEQNQWERPFGGWCVS